MSLADFNVKSLNGHLERGVFAQTLEPGGVRAYGRCGPGADCSGSGGQCGRNVMCAGGGGRCGKRGNCGGS